MTLPIPNQATMLVAGTIFAAAGLNLGVLDLARPASEVDAAQETADEPASAAPAEEVIEAAPIAVAPLAAEAIEQDLAAADGDYDDDDYVDDDDDYGDDDDDRPVTTRATENQAAPTSDPSKPTSAPTSKPRTVPTSPAIPTTSVPTSGAPTAVAPTTGAPIPSPTQPGNTSYLEYEFEELGTVIVALHDGNSLEFWSVETEPGWVYRVDDDKPSKVKVKFRRLSDGEEAEFELKFEDGELEMKMEL